MKRKIICVLAIAAIAASSLSVAAAADTFTAVSYTHLDVYKRQIQDRLMTVSQSAGDVFAMNAAEGLLLMKK